MYEMWASTFTFSRNLFCEKYESCFRQPLKQVTYETQLAKFSYVTLDNLS